MIKKYSVIMFAQSEKFFSGLSNEKGIILGMYNRAAIKTYPEIPDESTDFLNALDLLIKPPEALITSIASDPRLSVIFTAINNGIYTIFDFSIWLNTSSSTELFLSYKGRYAAIEQIAYDFITGNLYWCDSMYDWIAMKPIFTTKTEIYNVVIRTDLDHPEGLALDPGDRYSLFKICKTIVVKIKEVPFKSILQLYW